MTQTKYQIVNKTGDRTTVSTFEFEKRENADKFAASLNRRFPNRNYRVQPIEQAEKERFLEMVK